MDLSKFSDQDLDALEAGDLSKLSDAGLDELERQQSGVAKAKPVVSEEVLEKQRTLVKKLEAQGSTDVARVQRGILERMENGAPAPMSVNEAIAIPGRHIKAGYTGIADLIAGNGLDKAVENIERVKKGEEVTSGAGVWGEALGAQFTPEQIALQAAGAKAAQALGPWASALVKKWGEAAATKAIGMTKKIAQAIGIEDLSKVGEFLLQPITIGGKTMKPIVSATSTAEEMLENAKSLKNAAGKALEAVSAAADKAIKATADDAAKAGSMAGDSPVAIDLAGLKQSLEALKAEIAESAPNLGKAVMNQYDDALADVDVLIKRALEGKTDDIFSKLGKLKTTVGNLTFRHGDPLKSKAALNDVYHAVARTLENAAAKVGGNTAKEYALANAVYSKAITIVEALEGKVFSEAGKQFWDDGGAWGAGVLAGIIGGPMAGAATFAGKKAYSKYGPQAIASGLNKVAPLVSGGIELTARGVPVAGRAIASALGAPDLQEAE